MDPNRVVLIIFILLFGSIANLLILDLKTFRPSLPSSTFGLREVPATLPSGTITATPSANCGADCQAYINTKIANLKSELGSLSSRPSPSSGLVIQPPQNTPPPTPSTSSPGVIYVNFGNSGSTIATDFADVTGSQISFNKADYPGAKAFYFQANLRADAPDRTTYARVYDSNNSIPVVGSDINALGLTSTFKESGTLNLSSGSLVLKVQLHSLNGNVAIVEGARLKVVY